MKRLGVLALLAAFATVGAQTPKLKIGDPAPEIKVAKWVKGKPIDKLEADKKYVVEFWATWCGPCRTTIPHLTELAKKHTDVQFAGISIWEKSEGIDEKTIPGKIDAFVKEMGDKMGYSVAYEDFNEAPMAKSWMAAAGQDGIPSAFLVIDKKIAWIGHPDELGDVLDKVKAGTFDPKAEETKRANAEAEAAKMSELLKPVLEAAQAGDFEKAVTELDKVLAADPAKEKQLGMLKYNLLAQYDEKKFFEYGTKLAETHKDDAMTLNTISWMMLGEDFPLKTSDYPAAIKIAERANELTKGENAMILDTLALAYFKDKKIDKAIETQEKAISKMDKTDGMTDEIRKELKDRLEKFKKAKKDGES